MKRLTCADAAPTFTIDDKPMRLEFNGQALDLDDVVADYLLTNAPALFHEEPVEEEETEPETVEQEQAPAPTADDAVTDKAEK